MLININLNNLKVSQGLNRNLLLEVLYKNLNLTGREIVQLDISLKLELLH